eukprot:3941024-Rhodomonas_salina.1
MLTCSVIFVWAACGELEQNGGPARHLCHGWPAGHYRGGCVAARGLGGKGWGREQSKGDGGRGVRAESRECKIPASAPEIAAQLLGSTSQAEHSDPDHISAAEPEPDASSATKNRLGRVPKFIPSDSESGYKTSDAASLHPHNLYQPLSCTSACQRDSTGSCIQVTRARVLQFENHTFIEGVFFVLAVSRDIVCEFHRDRLSPSQRRLCSLIHHPSHQAAITLDAIDVHWHVPAETRGSRAHEE